jgi:cytochrome P450
LSRFSDVSHGLVDHETFSSGHGAIVEWIKKGLAVPSGILSFEHPPLHNIHRNLLARMFTARKINALEPKVREFCCRRSDSRNRTV